MAFKNMLKLLLRKIYERKGLALVLVLLAAGTTFLILQSFQSNDADDLISSSSITETEKATILENFGKQPLLFADNVGNYPDEVLFSSRGPTASFLFLNNKTILTFKDHALFLNFVNSNPDVFVQGEKLSTTKLNYFVGNNSDNWHTNISTYEQIIYIGLYPGINLVYQGDNSALKSTYYVSPNADPSQIKHNYEGADGLNISQEGNLEIQIGNKTLINSKPSAYQEINGKRKNVEVQYKLLDKHSHSFAIGDYDEDYILVIE